MAEEIQVDMTISCVNGGFDFPKQGDHLKVDQAVVGGASPGTITAITSTGTEIALTGFTKPGWIRFINLDETNFVTVGGWNDQLAKMEPGEPAMFRLNDGLSALWVRANTAACKVLVQIFED